MGRSPRPQLARYRGDAWLILCPSGSEAWISRHQFLTVCNVSLAGRAGHPHIATLELAP
jgi:hypothetical protein